MRTLELILPNELYARLVKAAQDQDLTLEEFAEETLSRVLELDEEDVDDEYDLPQAHADEDDDSEDWDDDDDDSLDEDDDR